MIDTYAIYQFHSTRISQNNICLIISYIIEHCNYTQSFDRLFVVIRSIIFTLCNSTNQSVKANMIIDR